MSDSIQRTSVGDFPISQTVTVPASASLIFVSGTLPDLHDANAPGSGNATTCNAVRAGLFGCSGVPKNCV